MGIYIFFDNSLKLKNVGQIQIEMYFITPGVVTFKNIAYLTLRAY